MLKIEENWWEGKHCLSNHTPWLVPEAVYTLDRYINKDDIVVECGTGGSTLFFAERCHYVTAVETCDEWGTKVLNELIHSDITNITYNILSQEQDILKYFEILDKSNVTIISVDTIEGFNRSQIFELLLCKYLHSLKTLVMDNYAAPSLWPGHYNLSAGDMLERLGTAWKCETFDDTHSYGSGTRIFTKE